MTSIEDWSLSTSQIFGSKSSSNSDLGTQNVFGGTPSGRFQRPSERVPFSDEGSLVFSEAPFKGGFTFGRL